MADIQYLNYGDLQIELLALMNSLANNVLNYVAKQSWSNKRKEKFMSAYSDLINKGILGASNNSGLWMIDVNGVVDLDSMDKKDKEMYGEAAYFIQQQMAGLPTKSSQEKKDEKSNLPVFDNEYFVKDFSNHLSKNEFGGRKFDTLNDWNELDVRNDAGLRGRTNRASILAKNLLSYANSLDESKLNFEGSPFLNLLDFKSRINDAVKALTETPDNIDDDNEFFRKLGLKASDWFNNGSGDSTTIILDDGTLRTITYGLLAEYNRKLTEAKLKLEEADRITKLKAIRANRYNGYRSFNFLNGTPGSLEDFNLIAQKLANQQSLDGNELSKISWAFRLGMKNGRLSNLSKEELAKFDSRYTNIPNRLKKLYGLEGIYYDSIGNRLIYPFKGMQLTEASLSGILELNSPEALKEKQNKQAAVNMNTPLSLMTEWTPEMKKEILAIAWDAASIFNPEAFSGSAMALYASHLRDEANPNRGTLEKWLDRGTAALGGIQGVGDLLVTGKVGYRLYLLGKSIGSVSKLAGLLGAGFGAIGAYEAKDSIAKLATDYKSLTPLDIENISYGLMGLIGLKSFAKARNKQTIGKQANPTTTEYNITIKDKNNKTHEIKIDETTAKEILLVRTLGKKKETVDSEILNIPKIKESIQKYKEANPTKKLEIEGASIVNDSKSAFGISGRNKVVTSDQVKNPNVPKYAPIGTKWYNPFGGYMAQGNNKWSYYLAGGWQRKAWENAAPEQSSKGLWLEFWNPEPKLALSETPKATETSKVTETPKATKTKPPTAKEIKELKENIKEFNKYSEGTATHSGNNLSEEPFKAGDFNFEVNKFPNSPAGNIDISFNGKVMKSISFDNLKDMMKKVANFLKENRKLKDASGAFIKKINAKEMGEILKQLKAKGVFKQGGTIDKQIIQRYKEFIKK